MSPDFSWPGGGDEEREGERWFWESMGFKEAENLERGVDGEKDRRI
jgi:hypothetical protein